MLTDHSDEVWFLTFSHDGSRLASGAKDGQIIIWNITVCEKYTFCRIASNYKFIHIPLLFLCVRLSALWQLTEEVLHTSLN